MNLAWFDDGLGMKMASRLDDGLGLNVSAWLVSGGRAERTSLDGPVDVGGANGIAQQRHDLEVERGHQCFDMCFDTHGLHEANDG